MVLLFYFNNIIVIFSRTVIGSDRKQFLSSDPTKNKNESDSIQKKNKNWIWFNSF